MRPRTLVHCTFPDSIETIEYTLGYPHAGCLALLDPFQDAEAASDKRTVEYQECA